MVLVMGVAGSGKSTQSQLIAKHSGWCWLSMGQILRENITGEQAVVMNTGKMLDDQTVEGLLLKAIKENLDCNIVLDGFPRRPAQAYWLLDRLKELNVNLQAVVHLKAGNQAALDRLLKRGRQDDLPESINERFDEYEKEIKPLIDILKSQGVEIINVNAEQPPQEVHSQVSKNLKEAGVLL
jgi:adenylate kinase